MKRNTPYLLLIVLLLIAIPCQAQRLDKESTSILSYLQKAMNFNRTTPQEKVYLHFDNTGYFENETMWFKAYIPPLTPPKEGDGHPESRTLPLRAGGLSRVLYVELLNPSGDVLKTTKWPIDSLGQANGDMKFDTLFGSGFYEVRAYTRYMTNWGVNACFSRVFPVFKAPKKEGDYKDLTIKTKLFQVRDPNNRDRSDSLYLNAIKDGIFTNDIRKTISVQFFPEGGDLIVGKKSRVAMLAVDDNGRPYQGEGFVIDKDANVIARVETDTLGRGLFEITPDTAALTMQMRNLKSNVKKSVQEFELPKAKKEGIALTLDAVNDDMMLTLQSTDGVCGRLLGLVAMHDGEIYYCDTITAEPLIELSLDRSIQKPGVNQFTVFDSSGQILAERLYFICPEPSPSDSIYFTSTAKRLKPCGSVVLDVKTQPNSTFSFSAIDAKNMTNGKLGNMKTWMLLSSEVKGYIHNVDYYFESDDREHRRSADLLMLTQGWRRYNWELMTGRKTFEKVQPIEDKFYVYGKLNEYRKKNPARNISMDIYLYNDKGESLVGKSITDENGNYAFDLPFVDGEWQMQMFTRINDKRKTFYVGIDRQFSPTPRYITPLEARILHPLKPNMFVLNQNEKIPEEEVFIPITERYHVLENVEVKAKRRYFTNDDWKYKNEGYASQYATLYYNIDKERENLVDRGEPVPTIFEFLSIKNKSFKAQNRKELPIVSGNPICLVCNGSGRYEGTIDTICNGTGEIQHIEPTLENSLADGNSNYIRWLGRMSYNNKTIKWYVNNGEIAGIRPDNYISHLIEKSSETSNEIRFDANDKYSAVTSKDGAEGDMFFPFIMDDIKSLYIVPNSPYESHNCVRIYLYTHQRYTTASQKGLRRTYFQGFNKPSTFKMEDYSVLPPMADFRRTIYWNPTVRTDAQGKAQVKFFNNSTCEEMYISAEGMSSEGKILVNE